MATVLVDRSTADPTPSAQHEPDRLRRPLRLALYVTVAAITARVGLPMLLDGPRLDETLTAWVVADGPDDAIGRSWRFQGQSPLYFAGLWIWSQVAGSSFVALRLPSLIAMVAAGWQLRRLATDLGLARYGDLVVASFALFSSVHVNAVTARPYAFLLLTVVLASRAGLRWSVSGSRAGSLRWAALCALAAYFQPFAIYAIAAQAWWLVVRRRAGASVTDLALPVVATGVLVLPLVPQVWSLAQRQGALAFAEVPPVAEFASTLLPLTVLLGLAAGIVVSRGLAPTAEGTRATPFVVAAALTPQVGLFVQSHLTGSGVVVAKYLAPATIGVALLVGVVVARFTRRSAVLVAATLMLALPILELEPQGTHEWDTAVAFLTDDHPDSAVVAMTGFIEAADLTHLDQPEVAAYLAAPLTTNGLERPVLPLPLGTGTDHSSYVDDLVERVANEDEIAIVRAVAGVPSERVAEEELTERGFAEVARIEPRGLLVTVWRADG